MMRLRRKLVATLATLLLAGLPFASAGAAFAASAASGTGSTAAAGTTSGSTAAAGTTSGTTTTTPGANGYTSVSFSDVTPSTPHYNAIEELAALGLVSGFPDGTYQPTANVTRAEFAKLIDIALGLQSAASGDSGPSTFSDVPAGQWYTGYINIASARGIINGYPDGTFRPNATVKYDEAVTMIVRALGYAPNVVGPWPSGYLAEAASIENSAQQYTLLSGLSDQLGQTMNRADVARLIENMLYGVPAAQQFRLTNGNTQVVTSAPTAATQAAQLGFNLFYPGNEQSGPPLSGCYGNVVTGTILTNPALNPNQVEITSLSGGSCGHSPVVAAGSANTYTLAPTVAIVGGTGLINLTGYQVSFVTNNSGQIVYIGAVTPSADALAGAHLGSQLTITNQNGVGQLPSGISEISLEPAGSSAYQSYDVAAGTVAVPTSGTFAGSNGNNDTVTAILNPNGDIISLIDTNALTQYQDVYLTAVATQNGVPSLQFYDGSVTPSSLGIAPGAAVSIDGNPAAVSALKAGMLVSISTNSQSQATSIQASDKTVNGTISNVTQTTGNTYLTVNGTSYEVRTVSAVLAQAGQVVSPANDVSTLDGLVNDTGTVYLGVDNYVGYIDVTNANTIIGMALSGVVNGAVEVEGGNGQVVAYPVNGATLQAGDIVRITLNPAGGTATITDYTQSGSVNAGSAAAPAEVLGVLGTEIQLLTPGGAVVDGYLPATTPVFEGTSGGGYSLTQLRAAGSGSIASTAGTTTPATLAPGDLVTVGISQTGLVEGLLLLQNDTTAGANSCTIPNSVTTNGVKVGTSCVSGAAIADGTVDVAIPSASSATNGQLGTASVVPMGSTTPVSLSVESQLTSSDQSATPQAFTDLLVNQYLGSDAGTNLSVFQLSMLGQSLIQNSAPQQNASTYQLSENGATYNFNIANRLTTLPTSLDAGAAAGLYFCGLTSSASGPAFYVSSNADCSAETSVLYGGGTVVVNVPNQQIEPVGSLVQGQQLYVYTESIPDPVGGTTTTVAEFVEVVNTATNTASSSVGSGTVTVNISDTGTTVTCATYTVSCATYAYEEYAVTGSAPGSTSQVPTVILSASNSNGAYPAFIGTQYLTAGNTLNTTSGATGAVATSGTALVGASGTSYNAFLFVPKNEDLTTTVSADAFGGTTAQATGSGQIVTP